MALDDLRQQARSCLLDLANWIWPDTWTAKMQEQEDRLKQHIRHGYDSLIRQRRTIETLHSQLSESEKREAALPWRVEAQLQVGDRPAAFQSAMELDSVRAELKQARARLQQLERGYYKHVDNLAAAKKRLGVLQMQIMRLRPTAQAS